MYNQDNRPYPFGNHLQTYHRLGLSLLQKFVANLDRSAKWNNFVPVNYLLERIIFPHLSLKAYYIGIKDVNSINSN